MSLPPSTSKGFQTSLLFLIIVVFLTVVLLGFNLSTLLGLIVVVPLAAIVFRGWKAESWYSALLRNLTKAGVFAVIFFTVFSLYILLFGRGQLGYGDSLKFQGTEITLYGYIYIAKTSLTFAAIAFFSAAVVSALGSRLITNR